MNQRTSPVFKSPDVEELARKLGCEATALLKRDANVTVCRLSRSDTQLVLKAWKINARGKPRPVIGHRILSLFGRNHHRLVVPEYYFDGHDEKLGHYVVMSFISGRSYDSRWHYHKPHIAGG